MQFCITVAGVAGILAGTVQQTLTGSVAILAASSAVLTAGTPPLGRLFFDCATA